jgi:hypothetical protein
MLETGVAGTGMISYIAQIKFCYRPINVAKKHAACIMKPRATHKILLIKMAIAMRTAEQNIPGIYHFCFF